MLTTDSPKATLAVENHGVFRYKDGRTGVPNAYSLRLAVIAETAVCLQENLFWVYINYVCK